MARLAHNAAVNYLRQRKYVKATQLLAANLGVTPALISETVLDRLNGVLDPEDRINGAVNLALPDIQLPVTGIGKPTTDQNYNEGPKWMYDSEGALAGKEYMSSSIIGDNGISSVWHIEESPDEAGIPNIHAQLIGQEAGNISLTDFYNAELMDDLTRQMRIILDNNPEYGEEMVTRWAHGLSVESGKTPFIIHQSERMFGQRYREATDGDNLDVAQSDMAVSADFTVPVPPTELGGIVITFAVVKPDETLASQPHPILSDTWGAQNYVSDELARDPVPVTIRELNADCDVGDEETRALYVGHNHLKKAYINYGFNRHMDLNDVANKTALWQLEVPMSVTPESVIYPDDLAHYPFADQLAEVCTYTISSVATVRTPMIFGPTPVEELAQIETDDIFEDAE